MLQASFPELAPVYGLVASLLFSTGYAPNNIMMSALSSNWNKKKMLAIGVALMSMTSIISGSTHVFLLFAIMRFFYGLFASAINVPIYQLIATNFSPKYRSTANAVETSGYWIGNGATSLLVLVIQRFGWRAMYLLMGSTGLALAAAVMLFIKDPQAQKVLAQANNPKPTKEEVSS